ncbi:hypothetical protein LMG33818_001485 [Halomonadaceae bacterium LMG 33818]|uniref:hypothetical protein n=1 Tax=Cernens ardua TaxID=3402176 RepID=UPI003EDC3877
MKKLSKDEIKKVSGGARHLVSAKIERVSIYPTGGVTPGGNAWGGVGISISF